LSVVVFHLIWFIIFWWSLCEKGRWERGEGEKEGRGEKGRERVGERGKSGVVKGGGERRRELARERDE
jgi:hypothetical protein